MVGAPRSNRCDTCRRRKVKCDEAWPVCGPCKKKNRPCPARPAVKFIDGRPGKPSTSAPSAFKLSNSSRGRRSMPSGSMQSASFTDMYGFPGTDMHVASLSDTLPLSETEQLCLSLIDTLQAQEPWHRLVAIGEFAWEVPKILGSSAALDSATSCLLSSQVKLLQQGARSVLEIDPLLYHKAIMNLNAALLDAEHWKSAGTLAATLILQRLDGIFGSMPAQGMRIHAAGIAALQEQRGPPRRDDLLGCQTTVDSHLSVVQACLAQRKECFMDCDAWDIMPELHTCAPTVASLFYRLLRLMTAWPGLVVNSTKLSEGSLDVNPEHVIEKAVGVMNGLSRLDDDMNDFFWRQGIVSSRPCESFPPLISVQIDITDPGAAALYCFVAMYSVTIVRILHKLVEKHPQHNMAADLLQKQAVQESRRVWMLCEYARDNRPLGLLMMPGALAMTYSCAPDEAAKRCIFDILEVLDDTRVSSTPWTEQKIRLGEMAMMGKHFHDGQFLSDALPEVKHCHDGMFCVGDPTK